MSTSRRFFRSTGSALDVSRIVIAGLACMKRGRRGPSHLVAKLGAQCTARPERVALGRSAAHASSIASNALESSARRRSPSRASRSFWVLPPAFLGGAAAPAGIALINSIGNLAGFVSPFIVGWIKDATCSTNNGRYVIAVSLAIGGAIVVAIAQRGTRRIAV